MTEGKDEIAKDNVFEKATKVRLVHILNQKNY